MQTETALAQNKPTLFMKKNGYVVNIVWLDDGVSVGVGDNDQAYYFNKNEWDMLREMLKPARYVQNSNKEKALDSICELIASVRANGAYPAESFIKQIIEDLLSPSQNFISQLRTEIEGMRMTHGTYCGGWHDMDNFELDMCSDCQAVVEYKKKLLNLPSLTNQSQESK